MRKILLISSALLAAGLVWAEQQTAMNQLHDIYAMSLANTYYFDEYYQMISNRHGVSDFDKLVGEAELLRWGAGTFDVGTMPGWHFFNVDEGDPLNVGIYKVHPVNSKDYIHMVNPHAHKPMPKLEEDPNYVDTEGMSVDDMFLQALGGDAALDASANSNYQGNYQTGVGGRTEQEGFDLELAKQIAKNANKQAAADEEYRRLNANNGAGDGGGGGFWANIGKAFMQSMADMAANFPAEYEKFQQQQAQKKKAIAAYNAQVDAYNRAQWENYYNQVNAQNSGYSSGGGSTYSAPRPQLSPAQQCEQRCRNTGSVHLHHRGSHWDGRICQCDVCDDRIQRC